MSVSETYIIGIDISPDGDESMLTISRHTGVRLELVKVFSGIEAEEMYATLTNRTVERSK